jgi:hypothetical protein
MMANSLCLKPGNDKTYCVNNRKINAKENERRTRVLGLDAEQQKMVKLHGMNWTRPSSDQKVCRVGPSILVVDSVANVVRQQVLNFDRRSQSQIELRVLPV